MTTPNDKFTKPKWISSDMRSIFSFKSLYIVFKIRFPSIPEINWHLIKNRNHFFVWQTYVSQQTLQISPLALKCLAFDAQKLKNKLKMLATWPIRRMTFLQLNAKFSLHFFICQMVVITIFFYSNYRILELCLLRWEKMSFLI